MKKQSWYMVVIIFVVLVLISFFYIAFTDALLVAEVQGWACPILSGKDEDHCFQDVAVKKKEPALCEKIKGESFSPLEGNPPRDKCYMKIAVELGDPSICSNIQGGLISYTPEMCLEAVATGYVPGH